MGMAEVRLKPDADSEVLTKVYEDEDVPWLREVVGRRPYRNNQRWVETPQGYIWAPYLQPVRNLPNTPVDRLPESSLGAGLWAEVTVPYVDLILANPPARSPWLQENQTPRLYFTQVLWVDQVRADDQGQIWYRINERYGYGDIIWAKAEAFRPLTPDEPSPIHPEVEEKRVVVHIAHQTLSCFEGNHEVYFARVSTGFRNDLYRESNGEMGDAIRSPSYLAKADLGAYVRRNYRGWV